MPYKIIGQSKVYGYLDEFEEAIYYAKQKLKPDAGITARAIKAVREGGSASIRIKTKDNQLIDES
jgi:hypothetical protein